MFSKKTYIERRKVLLEKMKGENGLLLLLGNAEAPAQYADNCYKFRQNSTWLYYFGIDEPLYAAIADLETGIWTIYADDVDINDIIWTGPMPSVSETAATVGIEKTEPYCKLDWAISEAIIKHRHIHTIPATRYFNKMKLQSLGVDKASEPLIKAIVSMRLVKSAEEIEEIDKACIIGQQMHTCARKGIKLGRIEQEIVGEMEGLTLAKGWGVSFPTILTQHGEIFHCHSHDCPIEPGKLLVIDAGAESNTHYASDFTRTYPTGGRYTDRQRDIYNIVNACHDLAFSLIKPGITYREVHLAVEHRMLEGLKALDVVRGDVDAMLEEGVCGLFMPHGLGHNMGLDVHDMEDLGENLVGYDPDQTRATRLGLRSLRMARKLVAGNVITDEPGIYFIPDLIRKWKEDGTDKGFVNYQKLETYFDFGGIRLEDDVLVTPEGARRLGGERLPATVEEIEEAMTND